MQKISRKDLIILIMYLVFFKKLRGSKITLELARKNKNEYESDMNEIKSDEINQWSKKAHCTFKTLYKASEKVINLLDGYFLMLPDAKYKLIHGKGRRFELATCLKVLAPAKICQVAHAQVNKSKISENILNEVNRIVYSLYRTKY